LAVAGFIALVGLGMWLAVYSTRFVPTVVNRLGAAAVYLGQVMRLPHPALSVVPTATSTVLSFADATSTRSTSILEPVKATPTAGTAATSTALITPATPGAPYGLPDLSVRITAVGYLATTSANSFVASSTVPAGSRPAVQFTIKNIGTNVTGPWRFSASIPTQNAYLYQSASQQSLAPGDSIDYTLGFDQANRGANQTMSVTANFDNAVSETTTRNNSASTTITVLGS
jgi:hypothetical protein